MVSHCVILTSYTHNTVNSFKYFLSYFVTLCEKDFLASQVTDKPIATRTVIAKVTVNSLSGDIFYRLHSGFVVKEQ